MSEHAQQCALFQWARLPAVVKAYPGIDLLEGTLNGVRLTKGQAGKAKAAGMLNGVHDVRLPVARGPYRGLSIEMKWGHNKPTDEQVWYGDRLRSEGWRVETCWDWIAARDVIVEYLMQQDLFVSEHGRCCQCSGSILSPTVREVA
jgi:hypothetical protein